MATGLMVAGLTLTTGATVAGAVQQSAGARAAAASANQTGGYNQGVAEYNKTMALQDANIARKLARNRAVGALQAGGKHIGSQRAQMAANGVDILEAGSSPMLLLEQTAADYAAAAELEIYNGEVEAVDLTNQAKLFQSQGEYAAWKGRTEANAYLAQAPTVLGTVLKVGGGLASGLGYMEHEGMFKK